MTVQLTDIYTALRDSVRFYPNTDQPCQQPKTWRVLQRSLAAEVSTQNLGATVCDKDKPFFWSRLWHEQQYNPNAVVWEFPLLYAFEQQATAVNPFGSGGKAIHGLQIGVLDKLIDTPEARMCVGCNSRTINEIYADTQNILFSCLEFLKNTRGFSVDGGDPVWANKDLVEQGIAAQRFDAVPVLPSILTESEKLNQEAVFFRAERITEKIYGTAINVRVAVTNCAETPEWNFTETDFGVLAQEAGCKTC